MRGWTTPPPKPPTKTASQFAVERQLEVSALEAQGLLVSARLKAALLVVPREQFIPREYRDYAYEEVPLPLPGSAATISCPHSYPLFYEPLGLDSGHRFLEVGTGSGYGAAVAREVVGETGHVTSIEIDPLTFEFAKRNLERMGYDDVTVVLGDGGLGYAPQAPYDRIAITAACADIPPPLIGQLAIGGRAIAPLFMGDRQELTLVTRHADSIERRVICDVLYIDLQGRYRVQPAASPVLGAPGASTVRARAGAKRKARRGERESTRLRDAVRRAGIHDARVLEAFRRVDRTLFVPSAYASLAETDEPIPIGHEQVTSQPSLIGRMVEGLKLSRTDRVLEIGTGFGYQTAILATLAREVYSMEILPDLAEQARSNLSGAGYPNATVVVGDGNHGLPAHAPYQAIIVSAAALTVPPALVEQLDRDGRLVQPIGPGGDERVIAFRKRNGKLIEERVLTGAYFVPLVGGAHGEGGDATG